MRTHIGGFALLAFGSVIATQAAVPLSSSVGLATATLYVSVNGSGSSCSKAAPCTLPTAMSSVSGGSTVMIEPGIYPSATGSYGAGFTDTNGAVTITGEPGEAPPVIRSNYTYSVFDLLHQSRLSHVTIFYTGTGKALLSEDGSSVDHVIVVATNEGNGACVVQGSTIANSLCINTAPSGAGIAVQPPGSGGATIRNVTAIATGAYGDGLRVDENGGGHTGATVSNSVFVGPHSDVESSAQGGGSAAVTLAYSDYVTHLQGAGGSITSGAGNRSAAPKFADAAHGDYREAAGSPTVDAGTATPANETDLAGGPRDLGARPDMGAYELAQRPSATALHITKRSHHALKVAVKVNPHGFATQVQVIGSHHTRSRPVAVGAGTATKTIKLAVKKLKRHKVYRLHAVATSSVGTTRSATTKAKTT